MIQSIDPALGKDSEIFDHPQEMKSIDWEKLSGDWDTMCFGTTIKF